MYVFISPRVWKFAHICSTDSYSGSRVEKWNHEFATGFGMRCRFIPLQEKRQARTFNETTSLQSML